MSRLGPFTALAACALAVPALAFDAKLTRTNGVLGTTVDYQIDGDPFEVYVLIPSLGTGPTPLAIVDPTDSRLLGVGLDLLSVMKVGVLNGAGLANASYPLPGGPSLQGTALYAQFVTIPGAPFLVDELSNVTSFRLGEQGQSTFTVGPKPEQLDGHTQTALADGRVLIAGGIGAAALNGFRLFDPQTQSFSVASGAMQSARTAHSATRLADGRVLLLGGVDELGVVIATGDVWDPATGLATPIANMSTPRVQHSATLLADGRVSVAGGLSLLNQADPLATIGSALASTAVYNPTTNTWSAGPNMPKPRVGHAATLLGTGKVLITCGVEITNLIIVQVPGFSADCRRYNPTTNLLETTPAVSGARAFHGQTLLSNGNVALAGGVDGDILTLTFSTLATTRVYNTGPNTWSNTTSLASGRGYPQVLATGGKVVALGGLATFDVSTFSGSPAVAIETSTEALAAWTSPSNMLLPRPLVSSTLIDGGQRILTTGTGDNGSGGAIPDLTAELFIP